MSEYHGIEMQYVINRQDGQALTPAEVDAVQDDLWTVMVEWLEARGLGMMGGTMPLTLAALAEDGDV